MSARNTSPRLCSIGVVTNNLNSYILKLIIETNTNMTQSILEQHGSREKPQPVAERSDLEQKDREVIAVATGEFGENLTDAKKSVLEEIRVIDLKKEQFTKANEKLFAGVKVALAQLAIPGTTFDINNIKVPKSDYEDAVLIAYGGALALRDRLIGLRKKKEITPLDEQEQGEESLINATLGNKPIGIKDIFVLQRLNQRKEAKFNREKAS